MTPADDSNQEETFFCPYCSQIFKHKRSRDRHLKLVSNLNLFIYFLELILLILELLTSFFEFIFFF